MSAWPQKPMSIGQILDRTFTMYRKHFGKFFLLMLIFFAPLYVIQEMMLNDIASLSMLPDGSADPLSGEYLNNLDGSTDFANGWLAVLFLVLIIPLTFLVSTPISTATVVYMVKAQMDGREVNMKEGIKRAFGRFWPLAGSTIVYGLIAFAMVLAIVLFIAVIAGIIAAIGVGSLGELGFEQLFSDPATLIVGGVLSFILFLVLLLVPGYFLIRWGFFMPAVAMEAGGIGLKQSWNLTKGNFWRVLAVYIVIILMTTVFTIAFQMITLFVLPNSIIGLLVQNLLTLLISPLALIAYAFTYFDLQLRREGTDLEALIMPESSDQLAEESIVKDE